jgi:hypothetical protein
VPYRGCRIPFSYFALPNSFSAIPRASGPVFIFFASERVFDGTDGVGSRFHYLGDIDGVESRFHVLRSRTCLGLYRGRRVPFSYFAIPDSLSTVPKARGLVFMFYALGIDWGCTKGGESCPIFMF